MIVLERTRYSLFATVYYSFLWKEWVHEYAFWPGRGWVSLDGPIPEPAGRWISRKLNAEAVEYLYGAVGEAIH